MVDVVDRKRAPAEMATSYVFTYGTLKRGFSNQPLMEDLVRNGDASYVGPCRTSHRYPLVCGPFRVPFLLNFQGLGERVHGELYAVTPRGMARMDELEGTARGHYERLPVSVDVDGGAVMEGEAYYGHHSYAEELWRRSGEKGYRIYSEKEACGYVKRKDRPQGTTFLDQIRSFIAIPSS